MTLTASGPLAPADLAAWYAVPPDRADGTWVRASFITTLDGRATGPDDTSSSLNAGSDGDHAVFEHLRAWADVVVVGAGTVRAEQYVALTGTPLAVVSTRPEPPASVLELQEGGAEVVLISGHGERLSAAQVLAALRQRGWRRIVVEGGPSHFGAWLTEGLVDELCVTVRPVLAGGGGPFLVPTDVRLDTLVGSPTHLLTWGGDVLVRTRLRQGT